MQELSNKHNNIIADACNIVETARQSAYQSVNVLLIKRNWLLGKRIAEEEQIHQGSEGYGKRMIENQSSELTTRYGKGFDFGSLYKYVKFYQTFPEGAVQKVFFCDSLFYIKKNYYLSEK